MVTIGVALGGLVGVGIGVKERVGVGFVATICPRISPSGKFPVWTLKYN